MMMKNTMEDNKGEGSRITGDLLVIGKMIHIQATVNDAPIAFQCDTCTTHSQIDLQTATRLGLRGHRKLFGHASALTDGSLSMSYLCPATIGIKGASLKLLLKIGPIGSPCIFGLDLVMGFGLDLMFSRLQYVVNMPSSSSSASAASASSATSASSTNTAAGPPPLHMSPTIVLRALAMAEGDLALVSELPPLSVADCIAQQRKAEAAAAAAVAVGTTWHVPGARDDLGGGHTSHVPSHKLWLGLDLGTA